MMAEVKPTEPPTEETPPRLPTVSVKVPVMTAREYLQEFEPGTLAELEDEREALKWAAERAQDVRATLLGHCPPAELRELYGPFAGELVPAFPAAVWMLVHR